MSIWVSYNSVGFVTNNYGGFEPTEDELNGDNYVVSDVGIVQSGDHYVLAGVLVARPEFPLTVNNTTLLVDEIVTVSDIPVGTSVVHPDGETVIDDGALEWDCDQPGVYLFTFDLWPYKTKVVQIEVTNA